MTNIYSIQVSSKDGKRAIFYCQIYTYVTDWNYSSCFFIEVQWDIFEQNYNYNWLIIFWRFTFLLHLLKVAFLEPAPVVTFKCRGKKIFKLFFLFRANRFLELVQHFACLAEVAFSHRILIQLVQVLVTFPTRTQFAYCFFKFFRISRVFSRHFVLEHHACFTFLGWYFYFL